MTDIEVIGFFNGIKEVPTLKTTTKNGAVIKEEIKTYSATIKLKKIAYDKEENQRPDTSDPWVNCVFSSFTKDGLGAFNQMKVGDEVLITAISMVPTEDEEEENDDSESEDTE